MNVLGFKNATPVQAATIPLFLAHKDVVVEATTGSGKTLAFVIPIIEMLLKRRPTLSSHEIGALIISPTRELAFQISTCLESFLSDLPNLKQQLLIGGNDPAIDLAYFQAHGANILVGTPGRLEDFLVRRSTPLSASALEVLVLDEADRLLDMGFEQSLANIIQRLPKQRRTGLFSATMTEALQALIRAGLRNPVKVEVKVECTISGAEQRIPITLNISYMVLEHHAKTKFLIEFLKNHPDQKIIVYFATCACVDYFYKIILNWPTKFKPIVSLHALHGKMIHKKRIGVYSAFTNSPNAVLFCTDLAARGLDFVDIDWVLQIDAPQDPKSFIHRCGRTARSGRKGDALLILAPGEEAYVDLMQAKQIPMVENKEFSLPTAEEVAEHCEILKRLNLGDRDLFDKSTKAFVSYARFYKEHHAQYIFRFKDLDFARLAQTYGLFRLPKMPELQRVKILGFEEMKNIDVDKIAFQDRTREKQRQASLKKKKETRDQFGDEAEDAKKKSAKRRLANSLKNHVPWSKTKDRRMKRNEKLVKRTLKSQKISEAVVDSHEDNKTDLDELDEDWKELKREKKAKNRPLPSR